MNHKRNSLLSRSYVPFTKVPEPGNECVSTILSALFRDGCLRNTIVARERAGTPCHQSAPRARRNGRCSARSASSCTRLALHAIRSSPATQASCSCDVVMVCTRCPVTGSVFADIDVRRLSWNGRPVDGAETGVRDVFMASIVFFRPFAVIPRRSQFLGTNANATFSGVSHG